MNPALILALLQGIKDGVDIVERLQNGDQTAEQAAHDWLGVTAKVEAAAENWDKAKMVNKLDT
jgi:hypothetical protein